MRQSVVHRVRETRRASEHYPILLSLRYLVMDL